MGLHLRHNQFVLGDSRVEILRALVENCNLSCNTVDDGQQVSVHSCFEVCDLQLKLENTGVDLGAVATR